MRDKIGGVKRRKYTFEEDEWHRDWQPIFEDYSRKQRSLRKGLRKLAILPREPV